VAAKIIPFASEVDIAWQQYLDARSRAESTGKVEDGIAAMRALGRFNELFVPELYSGQRR